MSPLFAAASSPSGGTLTAALLRAGADPSRVGWTCGPFGLLGSETPLHRAVEQGHIEAVKALVAAGADPAARGLRIGLWHYRSVMQAAEEHGGGGGGSGGGGGGGGGREALLEALAVSAPAGAAADSKADL